MKRVDSLLCCAEFYRQNNILAKESVSYPQPISAAFDGLAST
jgi:hypothetical protein